MSHQMVERYSHIRQHAKEAAVATLEQAHAQMEPTWLEQHPTGWTQQTFAGEVSIFGTVTKQPTLR